MKPTSAAYLWLTSPGSPVPVAGCITAVPSVATSAAESVFGVDRTSQHASNGDPETTPRGPLSAGFVQVSNGCLIIEDDGLQGIRPEVLQALSANSATGRAAAVYWNVNDTVIFGYAQRKKAIGLVDLGTRDDTEVSHLPSTLGSMLTSASDDTPRVALGAAMLVQFTGVGFTKADLRGVRFHAISPPPRSAVPDQLEYTPLYGDERRLAERIGALPASRQRALAETAAITAVQADGSEREPAVRSIVRAFGKDAPAHVPPEASVWFAQVERAVAQESFQQEDGPISPRLRRLHQRHWTIKALESACHPDASTAAWGSVYAGLLALTNAEMLGANGAVQAFKTQLEDMLT